MQNKELQTLKEMVAQLYAMSGKTMLVSPTHPTEAPALDMVSSLQTYSTTILVLTIHLIRFMCLQVIPSIGSNNVPVANPGVEKANPLATFNVPIANKTV